MIRTCTFSFLLLCTLCLLAACQEALEEVSQPSLDKVIVKNSRIADFIRRITLNDGSSDNILDHSSCISLVLPVTVTVNGQQMVIETEGDFKFIERVFDEVEDDEDIAGISFPITVLVRNYSKVTLTNHDDLEHLIEACQEGEIDEDIECIDFKYPLTLTVYDSDNQISRADEIANDEQLYLFFENLNGNQLVSFLFPIQMILAGGGETTVNNNQDLEAVIEGSVDACDEDDDNDYSDDDADDSGLIEALVSGTWQVSSLHVDDTDKTEALNPFTFSFNPDGTAIATDDEASTSGSWESYGDNGVLELEFDFGEQPPLDDLHADWNLIQFTTSEIKLEKPNEEGTYTDILVLKKK